VQRLPLPPKHASIHRLAYEAMTERKLLGGDFHDQPRCDQPFDVLQELGLCTAR
jgi:hypothetical protein